MIQVPVSLFLGDLGTLGVLVVDLLFSAFPDATKSYFPFPSKGR